MTIATEQFAAAGKAQFDGNLAFFSELSSKTFAGLEKMIDLNLGVVKTSLAEAPDSAQLFAVKDPRELLSLGALQTQPMLEKTLAYGQQVASIMSGTQSELAKAAEARVAETKRSAAAMFGQMTSDMPAGMEPMAAMWTSAFGNFNAGMDQFNARAKQAAESMEANMSSAVSQMSQAAVKVAGRGSKR